MKFMQIKPQKARGVLEERMWTDPKWVAEEKFDGDRRIAQFCGSPVRFTGTRESVDGSGFVEKTDNLPHFSGIHGSLAWGSSADARAREKLAGTVLDGEIVAPFAKNLPGGKSKYVTAIMGSKPERAIALQKQHGWLEYMVFDCLWYCGDDLRDKSLTTRRVYAARAVDRWANLHAKLVRQIAGPGSKAPYFAEIVQKGGEGVILKHAAHVYGDEKLWVKVKGEWTADVVIMGFEPGKGKYKGMVGAIKFGQYVSSKYGGVTACGLIEMGTCSGFDDALRGRLGSKDIGKIIEIKHNGREPTGAFRHPRFKRFRPDKSPKDCVYREGET